jgi:hypothetical protein
MSSVYGIWLACGTVCDWTACIEWLDDWVADLAKQRLQSVETLACTCLPAKITCIYLPWTQKTCQAVPVSQDTCVINAGNARSRRPQACKTNCVLLNFLLSPAIAHRKTRHFTRVKDIKAWETHCLTSMDYSPDLMNPEAKIAALLRAREGLTQTWLNGWRKFAEW